MKESPDYAELAARLLARKRGEARVDAAVRDRGISTVAQAMAERRGRGTRRWLLLGSGVLVAVGAVAAVALLPERRQKPVQSRDARVSHDLVGRSHERLYAPGSKLVASGEPLTVEFGDGTRLSLEERTEMFYEALGTTRRFRLLRGAVHLRVAKLSSKDRFIVETPDAEVEVRGTEFEVRVAPEPARCTSPTRVRVVEGSVELRIGGDARTLLPGQTFAACRDERPAMPGSDSSMAVPESNRAGSPSLPRRREVVGSRSPAAHAASPSAATSSSARVVEASSSLAAQNALYARAVAAKRAGSTVEALRLYSELLSRFPGGPLEESATVERMRLLARSDGARARSEARRYLERFPRGFARNEALALSRER